MNGISLPQEDADHESTMPKSMHGSSALEPNSYLSLIKKDRKVLTKTKDNYLKHWENGHDDEARESRTTQYASLVNK